MSESSDPVHVAVTGAAGYIGSRVVAQLQRDHPEWDVTALDNFYLGDLREIDDVAVEHVDIRNRDRLEDALAGADVVLHLAAISGVDDCDDKPDLAYEGNVVGTNNVAWFCRKTGAALCSQPTISRMENLADTRALIRMGHEMVRVYCHSFAKAPGQIVLDIDDTFDAVYGHQQLRLFNAYYDEYGFQPIVVFDGDGRLVGALLRPARRPKGAESAAHIRRLIRQIRTHWPTTRILLRADGHYATPQVLDLCDTLGLRYVFGLPKNSRLAEHILPLEASTATRYARKPGQKLRRFKTFSYAARSWSKPHRVIARVEVSPNGRDTRYIVTNLEGGRGKHLYEKLYSARGQAENHIKAWKTHLASDRTSCSKAHANQMRLMLHGAAYWMWWKLRAACPRKSPWRRAQFDTLRLHLVKLAATIVEKKTRIIVTLPASCPQQGLLRLLFDALAPPRSA
jgi:hypothetical protein